MKDTVKRTRRQTTDWAVIFAKDTYLIRNCYPEYTKNSTLKRENQLKVGKGPEETHHHRRYTGGECLKR